MVGAIAEGSGTLVCSVQLLERGQLCNRAARSRLSTKPPGVPRVNNATASKSIAALVGPTLLALGASTLVNLGRLPSLVEQVAREPALIMVSGTLFFVAGLAIVRAHHHWSRDWSMLVTLLGWLSLLGGLARILVPFQLADAVVGLGDQTVVELCAAIAILVVGAFLTYKGYVD